jgi:hypothetical protein
VPLIPGGQTAYTRGATAAATTLIKVMLDQTTPASNRETILRSALLTRLKHLEAVRAVEDSNCPLKVEFAYLNLLPREYSGPRHIVSVSKRPDGRYEYEERPGPPAAQSRRGPGPNVMTIYSVRAPETGNECDCVTD